MVNSILYSLGGRTIRYFLILCIEIFVMIIYILNSNKYISMNKATTWQPIESSQGKRAPLWTGAGTEGLS